MSHFSRYWATSDNPLTAPQAISRRDNLDDHPSRIRDIDRRRAACVFAKHSSRSLKKSLIASSSVGYRDARYAAPTRRRPVIRSSNAYRIATVNTACESACGSTFGWRSYIQHHASAPRNVRPASNGFGRCSPANAKDASAHTCTDRTWCPRSGGPSSARPSRHATTPSAARTAGRTPTRSALRTRPPSCAGCATSRAGLHQIDPEHAGGSEEHRPRQRRQKARPSEAPLTGLQRPPERERNDKRSGD